MATLSRSSSSTGSGAAFHAVRHASPLPHPHHCASRLHSFLFLALALHVLLSPLGVLADGNTATSRHGGSTNAAAPLSPLQAYLYSHAATADTVVLAQEGASRSLSGASSSSDPGSIDKEEARRRSPAGALHDRRVVYGQADADADGSTTRRPYTAAPAASSSSASSSSSPRSGGARSVASLAASLTGRYVVLSRTTVSAPADIQPAQESILEAAASPSPEKKEPKMGGADEARAVPLSEQKHAASTTWLARRSRVFPEEALQLAVATAAAYRAEQAYAVGGRHAETLQETHAQLSDLEVHVIDASHLLVYLPPTEASAALLRALSEEGDVDGGGASWKVWDAFQSGHGSGGPLLKLSESLRRALQLSENASDAYPNSTSTSRPFLSALASGSTRYEVTLWTARGRAAAVHDALAQSTRLRRYMVAATTAANATLSPASSACRLKLEAASAKPGADVVWVHVEVAGSRRGNQERYSGDVESGSRSGQVDASSAVLPAQQPQPRPQTSPDCLRDVLLTLAAHPAVRWVEESYRRPELLNSVATRTLQRGSCSTYVMGDPKDGRGDGVSATPFWDSGFDGSDEVIAIADSGVDTESCFFKDPAEPVALYPNLNPRHRKILSYLAYVDDEGLVDAVDKPAGHGTHVAGTAGGCALPSVGATKPNASALNGVAPGAKLFVRDMNIGDKNLLSLPANLREIFDVAYDVGARISSNSWGFGTDSTSYLAMEKMFDTAIAERRNFLVLAAVSNSGKNVVYIPGRAKNVLTVGSHLNSKQTKLQNTVPDRSGYGVTYDRRRKPDLVAPGGGRDMTTITSARAVSDDVCATTTMYGTSMATAAAAGAAAVLRQYLRREWQLPDPSSALLRAALLHSTTTAMSAEPLRRGFGRIDLSLLLPHPNSVGEALSLPAPAHWLLDDAVVHDGETLQYCFDLANLPTSGTAAATAAAPGEEGIGCSRAAALTVKATLVWNDPGTAVEGSSFSQVHDLDLMLVTPHGHTFFSGQDGASKERFSTAEQVRVPLVLKDSDAARKAGTSTREWMWGFRLLVRGDVVRSAAGQPFALLVTGPGLVARPTCPPLFSEWHEAAAAEASSAAFVGAAACPMNCSGHGTCDSTSLLCQCKARYTSVDCAECNADVLCHGHGTCDTATMTCTCDPRGHFADAFCSTCAKGWYGPDCASNCVCLHGGVCDTATGLCSCVQDTALRPDAKGCFHGSQCQYCCEGSGGAACNQRSYWCNATGEPVVVDDPGGGFIQINGYETYGYSLTCRWTIRAPPGQQISLEMLTFRLEAMDSLSIYDVVPNTAPAATVVGKDTEAWQPTLRKRVRRITGGMDSSGQVFKSTMEQMDVEFVSDWEGTSQGFVLYYRFISCSDRCTVTNLTGALGHWRCGDIFGLPTQQCICEPPYVGWNCNQDASDISQLSPELNALDISQKRAWQDGELAWMLPRSVLTAAEVRLPVLLQTVGAGGVSPVSTTWGQSHPAAGVVVPQLTLPVEGLARLPLVVHGFTELQVPLLTLPSPSSLAGSGGARQPVTAQLRLSVQLQVEPAWLDNGAAALELALGVSAATEIATEGAAAPPAAVTQQRRSASGSTTTPWPYHSSSSFISHLLQHQRSAVLDGPPLVRYNDTAAALSFNAFTFTPMALQKLVYCADVPVVELTVPLNLLVHAPAPSGNDGNAAATDAGAESHWTARLLFTLLWKDAAGLKVPNVSVVDAVVVAREVVLVGSAPLLFKSNIDLPVAGPTLRGKPLAMSCHAVARVPVRTGRQVVQAAGARVAQPRAVSSTVFFVVLFCALCVGVVGGTLWVLWWAPDRHRNVYVAVQAVEEGQDMQVLGKRQ